METINEISGVKFVDDSKATNMAALTAALETIQRPVRLIAGGRLKEDNPIRAKELLARRAISAYLIGEGGPKLRACWNDVVNCRVCSSLNAAVVSAWEEARDGDVILLSPGCASFDQFGGFEERGECFKESVRLLTREE